MNIDKQPDAIELVAVCADGGTLAIAVTQDGVTHNLSIDYRLDANTKGEVYNSDYPEKNMMIPSNSVLAKAIKAWEVELESND